MKEICCYLYVPSEAVEYNLVKLETSCTVIHPPTVSVLWCTYNGCSTNGLINQKYLHNNVDNLPCTGVGKCLKVVHSNNQSVTIGQAMVACAADQARLVPIKSCNQGPML